MCQLSTALIHAVDGIDSFYQLLPQWKNKLSLIKDEIFRHPTDQ